MNTIYYLSLYQHDLIIWIASPFDADMFIPIRRLTNNYDNPNKGYWVKRDYALTYTIAKSENIDELIGLAALEVL